MYERILPRLGAASGALFVVLLFGLVVERERRDDRYRPGADRAPPLHPLPRLSLERPARGRGSAAAGSAATALGAGLVDVTIKLGSIAPG